MVVQTVVSYGFFNAFSPIFQLCLATTFPASRRTTGTSIPPLQAQATQVSHKCTSPYFFCLGTLKMNFPENSGEKNRIRITRIIRELLRTVIQRTLPATDKIVRTFRPVNNSVSRST